MRPAAEIEADGQLVRSLLADQCPEWADLPLRSVEGGWDNTLWRLGDTHAVRLPRRRVAVALTINEQRWLPRLAPRLPLPLPAPVVAGKPTAAFAWPWSVVRWLPGDPGDRTPITDPLDCARRLGRFLKALHHPAPPDAPHNPYRSVPLADRRSAFDAALDRLGSGVDGAAVRQLWAAALGAAPGDGPPVWIHGDLHPANTLIQSGTLAAVIDFGDLCAGDPATDLAGAWLLLPSRVMPTFAATYGEIGPDLERRALGWAALFALMLVGIGVEGRPTYEAVGRSALARAVERAADLG